MKWSRFFLVSLTVLPGLALTLLPSHAQDLGVMVSQPGVFSYQAPKGWIVQDTTFSKYKESFDAPKNGFRANINVVVENFPGTLAKYVRANQANFKASPAFQNFKIIDEKAFTTRAGITGVRMVSTATLDKTNVQQIYYFFEGPDDTKFVVTATSLVGDGGAYMPIFDASLKTFSQQ